MRIDCPRALSQITSLNSGGQEPLFQPSRPAAALAARSCSVAQGSRYVHMKSPRVGFVGARLLVWARCFDLPFRGVAAIHMGLDREKQNGSASPPAAPSGLPPCRCGIVVSQLCSCVCSCPLLALLGPSPLVFRNWLAHSRSVLTVDARYFAYCSRTTFLHSMYAGAVATVARCHAAHLGTPVRVTKYAHRNTGTSSSLGLGLGNTGRVPCLTLP